MAVAGLTLSKGDERREEGGLERDRRDYAGFCGAWGMERGRLIDENFWAAGAGNSGKNQKDEKDYPNQMKNKTALQAACSAGARALFAARKFGAAAAPGSAHLRIMAIVAALAKCC